jgi:hypothetical protein
MDEDLLFKIASMLLARVERHAAIDSSSSTTTTVGRILTDGSAWREKITGCRCTGCPITNKTAALK